MEKMDFKEFYNMYCPCAGCEDCNGFRFMSKNKKCGHCEYFAMYQLLKEIVCAEDMCKFCFHRTTVDGVTNCPFYETTDGCYGDFILDLGAVYDACAME